MTYRDRQGHAATAAVLGCSIRTLVVGGCLASITGLAVYFCERMIRKLVINGTSNILVS